MIDLIKIMRFPSSQLLTCVSISVYLFGDCLKKFMKFPSFQLLQVFQYLFIGLAIAPIALADNPATVQQTFSDYKSAILAGQGEQAVDELSQNTIDYYGDMRRLAVCEPAEQIKAESMVNRIQILSMRFRVPTDTLVTLSDREVVVYGVDQGWIGKESVMNIETGEVKIQGEEAFVDVLQQGQPSGIQFRFAKESDGWKLDLLPTIELSNRAFEQLAELQELEQNDFIFGILAILEGREPTEDIWNPVAPNDPLCSEAS